MKKLFIVRHAKSSWSDPNLDDFDRPLNKRGKKAGKEMGRRLAERNIHADALITSPAKRALATAKLIAKQISFSKKNIIKEPLFYEASNVDFLTVIKKMDDEVSTLMIFSHNPGLTALTNYLSGTDIYNIPTCGIAEIDFDINSWKEIGESKGQLVSFDYPKKIS
jgi:phosphohistidine phosphatase